MACPILKYDPITEQDVRENSTTNAPKEPAVAHPQTSAEAFDKANKLIHELYGNAFRELSKV